MNLEEVEELARHAATHAVVLKFAVGALISTHPDPEKFAKNFSASVSHAQIEHALNDRMTSKQKALVDQEARDIAGLALDVAQRRRQRKR